MGRTYKRDLAMAQRVMEECFESLKEKAHSAILEGRYQSSKADQSQLGGAVWWGWEKDSDKEEYSSINQALAILKVAPISIIPRESNVGLHESNILHRFQYWNSRETHLSNSFWSLKCGYCPYIVLGVDCEKLLSQIISAVKRGDTFIQVLPKDEEIGSL